MRPLVEQQHIDEIRKLMNERDEAIRAGDDRRAKQACETALHRYGILINRVTVPGKRRQYEEAAEKLREDIRILEHRLEHPEERAQNVAASKKKELCASGDGETNTAENLLLVKTPNVKFSDIAGLDDVKEKFIVPSFTRKSTLKTMNTTGSDPAPGFFSMASRMRKDDACGGGRGRVRRRLHQCEDQRHQA
jgi:hypothetical protein